MRLKLYQSFHIFIIYITIDWNVQKRSETFSNSTFTIHIFFFFFLDIYVVPFFYSITFFQARGSVIQVRVIII